MAASQLGAPGDLTDDERAAVEALLYTMADDEFVLAERYTEWQVVAPTLESDLSIANIAQDEYGHARLWYDLLEDFGHAEEDLIWERDPADFRHATLVELPFGEGGWADTILRGYCYDVYEHLHLEALAESSYPRLVDRVEKVQGEEAYHMEHAQNWLERLCDDEPGRAKVQAAVDELFPYALTLFVPTEQEAAIVDLGVRPVPIGDLRTRWFEIVIPFLGSLGLDLPVTEDGEVTADLPAETGRRGDHTDDWFDLFEEFTFTYHDMEYAGPPEIMKDPDDV